jgi:hypothetical protein
MVAAYAPIEPAGPIRAQSSPDSESMEFHSFMVPGILLLTRRAREPLFENSPRGSGKDPGSDPIQGSGKGKSSWAR